MSNWKKHLAFASMIVVLLAACGQKGPLTLPKDKPSDNATANKSS